MPQFIRHHINSNSHTNRINWILPVLTGLLIGCLLAFVANLFLKEMRLTYNDNGDAFEVSAESPPKVQKPGRYEAVKSNWQQYRANQPKD